MNKIFMWNEAYRRKVRWSGDVAYGGECDKIQPDATQSAFGG